MSLITVSVLSGILVCLVIAFIVSLFQRQKLDLHGRFTKEEVNAKIFNKSILPISESGFGRFYKKHLQNKIEENAISKMANLFDINLEMLQNKIILAEMEDSLSAVEILAFKIIGIFSGLLIGTSAFYTKNVIVGIIAFLLFIGLFLLPTDKINDTLKKREEEIVGELPQFIEQTYMCVEAGATLRDSLDIVAEKRGGILGNAIKNAFIMSSYSGGWENELTQLSRLLGVDPLEDFINDILVAHSKGTSIADTLRAEVDYINSLKNSKIKEKISSLESKMLLPIIIFFMMPMMALVIGPTILQSLQVLS